MANESATLELGGGGEPGELRLLDAQGRTAVLIGRGGSIVAGGSGTDGDLVLKDHADLVVFQLDAGSANVDFGGRGHNADIRMKNSAGDITLHLDASLGDIVVRGKAVKLGADHVFERPLPELAELARFLEEHRHLPGVPSADEMARDGAGLADLAITLLEKVEELTLHVIRLDARIRDLESRD